MVLFLRFSQIFSILPNEIYAFMLKSTDNILYEIKEKNFLNL